MRATSGLAPGVRETAAAARSAAVRLAGHVRETPLWHSPRFSARTGANVWFKLENLQHTGSFKVRGAFNRLLALEPAQRAAGAVAASSGNHGAAVARALEGLGMHGVVFVPENASPVKVAAIRAAGCEVRHFGADGLETELHARAYAEHRGMVYVSPYNDPEVVAGQGTCGVEIVRQLPGTDAVFIAVGGGGLAAGTGSVLKDARREIAVIGCQPEQSAVMHASLAAGGIVQVPGRPTLSDGTAGGIEPGAITFDLCRDVVDEWVLVGEAAIAAAMRDFMDTEHQLLEGAAGVALAAFLQRAADYAGRNVVVLICGANISRDTLATILQASA
ncbi:MAG TPA: threonine/serine dehydratase [Woeseiaceae bacterium]|nr:threonine/serine dehydratase [Woeseiaceae bacterium]